jgi:hypothetical protein
MPAHPVRPRSERVMRAFITVVVIVLCFKVLVDPEIGVTIKLLFPVVMAAAWWRLWWRPD